MVSAGPSCPGLFGLMLPAQEVKTTCGSLGRIENRELLLDGLSDENKTHYALVMSYNWVAMM